MHISDHELRSPRRSRHGYSFSAAMISGLIVILDALVVAAAGVVSYLWVVGFLPSNTESYFLAISLICFINFMIFHYGGLYRFEAIMNPFNVVDMILVAYVISFFIFLAIAFSLKVSSDYSRIWIYSFATAGFVSLFATRFAGYILVKKLAASGAYVRRIAVIMSGEQGDRLIRYIEESAPDFLQLVNTFDVGDVQTPAEQECDEQATQRINELVALARSDKIDDIVIALPWSSDKLIEKIIDRVGELPVNILLSTDLVGYRFGFNLSPEHYSNMPIVEIANKPISDWDTVYKNLEDIVLGSIALVLLAPVMLLVALAIKLDSRGPVLFKQQRMGFNNEIFDVYKFRSMHHETRPAGPTVQATRGDPRVTRVGWFIRRTSLDELPQLLNVLGGTMSLVGPRPHVVDQNLEYSDKISGYFARHRVKPGITGWAQVNGLRGETEVLEKMEARIRYDKYYVDNWSLLFDFKIIIKTIFVVLFSKNAY